MWSIKHDMLIFYPPKVSVTQGLRGLFPLHWARYFLTRFFKKNGSRLSPRAPLEGPIQTGSTSWQGFNALTPLTKFGSNRPIASGGDVFVKCWRTGVRPAGHRTHFMRLSKRHNLKTKQELTLLTLNARTKKIKRCSLIYKCQRRKDRINAASIIPNIRRINYLLVYIGRYSRKRTTLRCRMTSLSTTEKLRRLLYQRIIIAFASKSNNKAMHLKCLDILLKQSKSKICSHEVNILIKPIKLNRMHEIAVICDSEQFSRAYTHEISRERAPFRQFPDDDLG